MSQSPLAPPPPTQDAGLGRWLYLLWKRVGSTGQILWSYLDFTGSNLTDIATRNHADLQNIDSASYTHLSATNHTDLTDGGATTLHKHDHGGMDGLADDDHAAYLLASDATNRATFAANWTDLTDGGATTLHTHSAGSATAVDVVDAGGDATTFVMLATAATGTLTPATDAGLSYDATTNILTVSGSVAANLTGNVTGNVSGSAGSCTGNSATVTVADAAGDATTFVMLATAATGSLTPATDAGISYDATTNILTVVGSTSSDLIATSYSVVGAAARESVLGYTPTAQFIGSASWDDTLTSFHANGNNIHSPWFAMSKIRGSSAVQTDDYLGEFDFIGYSGTAYRYAASIWCWVDDTVSDAAGGVPAYLAFATSETGQATPVERLGFNRQAAQAYVPLTVKTTVTTGNATATVAASELLGGIYSSTPTADITLTLPTGTNVDAYFSYTLTSQAFEWSCINLATAYKITLAANTDHTIIGSTKILPDSTARFITRRSAANTWVTYRIAESAQDAYHRHYPLMDYGGLAFNGSDTYLDGSDLAGITDTKTGTFVCKVRFAAAPDATSEALIYCSAGALTIQRQTTTGKLAIIAENAGGTQILSKNSTDGVFANADTYTIMASWDLATATFNCYVNDEPVAFPAGVLTNDTIDYTVAEYGIGATNVGGSLLEGDIYSMWFDETRCLDFSDEAVRRKFFDSQNNQVFLGHRGELPTGSIPILFLGYGKGADWGVERGASTDTWVQNGTIANPGTAAYGQYALTQALTSKGHSVTQATSRTTGVTLNRHAGSITLVSAAGSTSWQSFTVTNDKVAATDTVRVVQKSGTDKNMIHVTAVAAGSFQITFATTGGTTTEQPVFNFVVVKGVPEL